MKCYFTRLNSPTPRRNFILQRRNSELTKEFRSQELRRLRGAGHSARAGEMIPEVEGTRPWGPPGKRVHKCLKGPKTTYTTIVIVEKQSKRSKKGPFSLYLGPLWSHPGNGICGARKGRSLPVTPGFSGHAFSSQKLEFDWLAPYR